MHVKPKSKKVRVKHTVTGELSTVEISTAKQLVASGDWEYVEGD